jgi:UDP-N-acetylglucosamine 2-epimerase (non-hydrolysing)
LIKVSIIFGTRPEVIKLSRVIKELQKEPNVELNVCFTGQHKEMVLPLVDFFEIKIDHALDIMMPNQTLAGLSSLSIKKVDEYLEVVKPDIVFVQGDTTTAMCAATAAFYRKIKVAHVEAGLRTNNMFSPFPEEFNRQVISKITDIHFAPTEAAKENLLKEGVNPSSIFVTGNTVIDALLFTKNKVEQSSEKYLRKNLWDNNLNEIILITGHRRENFGPGFENMCTAIKQLAERYPNYNFVYPVHLNPNVQEPVKRILNGLKNVYLIPPMDYIQFTALMSKCYFILTDSGGVQEEAPTLGKPVLVMRDTTEREEAVAAGAAKLVGTDKDVIVNNATALLENKELFNKMSRVSNPFGDGSAAVKIVEETLTYFE